MSEIGDEIEIAAAPERVWEIVMDPHRLHEWVSIHESLDGEAPAGPVEPEAEFTQTLKLGTSFDVRWKVVQAEAPERAVWEGDGPAGSQASIRYRLEPSEQGTRFRYENGFDIPTIAGPAAERATGRPARRELSRSLEALKELCEGG